MVSRRVFRVSISVLLGCTEHTCISNLCAHKVPPWRRLAFSGFSIFTNYLCSVEHLAINFQCNTSLKAGKVIVVYRKIIFRNLMEHQKMNNAPHAETMCHYDYARPIGRVIADDRMGVEPERWMCKRNMWQKTCRSCGWVRHPKKHVCMHVFHQDRAGLMSLIVAHENYERGSFSKHSEWDADRQRRDAAVQVIRQFSPWRFSLHQIKWPYNEFLCAKPMPGVS